MSPNAATGLAITNPLVKYRALVATRVISPDNGQLRLALHLQKLYERLKDYEPQEEYSHRLDQISRAIKNNNNEPNGSPDSNPPRRNSWRTLLTAKEKRNSLALTRKLTSHESALQLSSPKGLLLHGEVGTGKSLLIDLFADCLPTRKKRRWHFNTFMLETFAKLEALRRQRSRANDVEQDYPLLCLARDMIRTSPILFLDEFQMPDRVASKILTNLMTSFFHLGGVLVATSNRMPEELARASGVEFAPPPPSRLEALGWRFGLRSRGDRVGGGLYAGQTEFAAFLEVLKARCDVWEMEGGRDYRRVESGSGASGRSVEGVESDWELDDHDDLQSIKASVEQDLEVEAVARSSDEQAARRPLHYHLSNESELGFREAYAAALQYATGESPPSMINFTPNTMQVYGRTITIPRTYKGVCEWTFSELCKTTLGPADYTTLASNYHTLLLRDVPILTSQMKNEARRFITLLDALYECRCKLFITAEAGPDDLFFPEKKQNSTEETDDAIQSETFSEAYQDATAPFRPNILTENPNYAESNLEPDYTHARLAGLLNADALEDDPPNKPFGRSFGRADAEMARRPIDPDESRYYGGRAVDFSKTGAFTGEDEKFAYKRARSRLWEMCGRRWWARREQGWHRPLPVEVRRWERAVDEGVVAPEVAGSAVQGGDVGMGQSTVDETRDESMFRHGASPFRTSREPPPKLSWVHAWGLMKWGPRAGAWGKGPEGLQDRGNEKR